MIPRWTASRSPTAAVILLLLSPGCLVRFGAPAGDGGPWGDASSLADASGIPDAWVGDAALPDGSLPDGSLPDGGPNCGDGVVDSDEECDDGNSSNTDGCTNACKVARCGDGVIHQGEEECDDGNQSNADACLNDCRSARCGDGYLWSSFETCDDQDTQGSDGCSATCQVESGYSCLGQPSICSTVCGDGLVRGSEACDDGNLTDGDGCSGSCTQEALPTLYWIGGTSTWSTRVLTWANEPHAPSPTVYPIVAAATSSDSREAFVLTHTSYHVLDLTSHAWIDSGTLGSFFPGLPPAGRTLHSAMGISFGTKADLYFMYDDLAYIYYYDFASGTASAEANNPFTVTHWTACCGATVPYVPDIRVSWFDPSNARGWTSGSYATICEPGCPCGTEACTYGIVGPYDAHINGSGTLFLKDLGCCDRFYSQSAATSFSPFTRSGAPWIPQISAAFYDVGTDLLYAITDP